MKYLSLRSNGDAARIATIGLLAARRSRGPLWRGLLLWVRVPLWLRRGAGPQGCHLLYARCTEYPEKGSRLKESFKTHDFDDLKLLAEQGKTVSAKSTPRATLGFSSQLKPDT